MILLEMLVNKYNLAYRIYADFYHMHRFFRNYGRNNCDSEIKKISSIKDMIENARERSYKIYGRQILEQYCDGKNTVLFISHDLTLSGAPMVLYHFASVLHKHGCQVLMISPQYGRVATYAEDHGIPVMVIGDLFESDFLVQMEGLFSKIIVNTIVCALAVQKLQKLNVPVLWWIHEAAAAYGIISSQQMPRLLPDHIHVYCAGAYAQKMLKKKCPLYKSGILLYHVPDQSMKMRRTVSDKKVFATVGMVEYRKGQDILLEAIDLLPDEIRNNCCFIIVGTVTDEKMREQIIQKRLKCPKQFVFVEGLEQKELFDMYRKIDFLICSSRDDPMPVVITEAMSQGKPCICSENTGSAAIIERYDAGFVYYNDDPDNLTARIMEAYNMAEGKYSVMSENARYAYEENFSEKAFLNNVGKII